MSSYSSNYEQHLLIIEQAPKSNCFKFFLNRHSNLVDFLTSSIVIIVCLTLLLPRVLDSFAPKDDHQNEINKLVVNENKTLINGISDSETIISGESIVAVNENNIEEPHHIHHHHHNHTFPVGPILICIGFFVFYCIGLKLNEEPVGCVEKQLLLDRKRSMKATVCCSSTRCPASSQPVACSSSQANQQLEQQQPIIDSANLIVEKPPVTHGQIAVENECLLLLNRHHQHHTHNRHHEHLATTNNNTQVTNRRRRRNSTVGVYVDKQEKVLASKRSDYGTASSNHSETDVRSIGNQANRQTSIVVDEIRITSPPPNLQKIKRYYNRYGNECWPHSIKMLFVCLLLAAFLIMCDMNILGLLRTLKVFRAASTGALLYIAFFIMLPRQSAGCNSCQDEES